MPAKPVEVNQAVDEGVQMRWLSTIAYAEGGAVSVERMRLDESGFPQPTGEYEQLPADSVVLAIGQEIDRSIVDTLQSVEIVRWRDPGGPGHDDRTRGVFAGGDLVAGERTGRDWRQPVGSPPSMRWSAASTRQPHYARPAAACPVATVSNATTATACARTTPSLSSDRGNASGSIWTTARVAASARQSAHAETSS